MALAHKRTLQLLAGLCASLCLARAASTPFHVQGEGRARRTTTVAPETAVMDNSAGYTVSFMPLFMLIAKFLPRLLGRFNYGQPARSRADLPVAPTAKLSRTSTRIIQDAILGKSSRSEQEAAARVVRDGYIQQKGSFCSMQHLGRWRDLGNCRQYYECHMSLHPADGCFTEGLNLSLEGTGHRSNVLEGSKSGQKVETINSPCVTMTLYKCPRKHYYSDSSRGCEPVNTSQQAELCHGT